MLQTAFVRQNKLGKSGLHTLDWLAPRGSKTLIRGVQKTRQIRAERTPASAEAENDLRVRFQTSPPRAFRKKPWSCPVHALEPPI